MPSNGLFLGLQLGYIPDEDWDYNTSMQILDNLSHITVQDYRSAPPVPNSNGMRFLVNADAASEFAGKAQHLAIRAGGQWYFYNPASLRLRYVFVEETRRWMFYDAGSSVWRDVAQPILSGTMAARPAASSIYENVLYYATDVTEKRLYVCRGVAWETASPAAVHATAHAPGGADALPWGTIHGFGTLAARPAAASTLEGYTYLATDVNGGTPYRCSYVASAWTWVQAAKGVHEGGGGRPLAQMLDAGHELVYTFAQSSGDFANSGNQGAGQNIATIGTCLVRRGEQGPFGDCARVQATGTPLTGNTYNPPGGSFSVEIWFSPSGFPTNPMYLANKSRLTSGQSGAASDTAIGLYLTSGRNLGLFIWAGGAMRSIETTDAPVLQGVWQHLAGTFDGANLKLYWNGSEVAAGAYAGSVDYGTPGRWHFATFPGLNSFGVSGILGSALVSSVARSSAYMKAAYRNGMPGVSAAL
jgi:hypothetical protein